jgi:acetyltransferase
MHKFFFPGSLVVFGASTNRNKLGSIVLLSNKQHHYRGNLYGIGSQEGDLEGIHIYADVESLPEIPDVAVLVTPASSIPELMEACGRKGIDRIIIESGGFSEYSHNDHSLEDQILAIAEKYRMKIIGPNCIGVINFDIGMMTPFVFYKDSPIGGRVALIAQSGGIGEAYMRLIEGHGVKCGKFAATGNKLQLDETDFLDYFIHDKDTDIIAFYLEGFKRGRDFFELARRSPKPIVIQKSNRSPVSAKIAQSHTTALSSDDEVVDSAFHQAAIIRAESEIDCIHAVQMLQIPLMKGRRVAVLSRSGGHAVISADACARFGFEMVPFPPVFFENLKTIYNSRVVVHQNPLDLGEIFDYTLFTGILEEVLKLDEVDGVLFNHVYSNLYEVEMSRSFLASVEKLGNQYGKPVAIAVVSDREEVVSLSKHQAYPVYRHPLESAFALHVSASYYERKLQRDNRGPEPVYDMNLDAIRSIIEHCHDNRRIALTNEALDICSAAGIHPIKGQVIRDTSLIDGLILRFPVALKLLSRDASHKSDIGGVIVNIRNRKALIRAVSDMRETVMKKISNLNIDGYLVQEMAPEGTECFVGGRRDPSFGPVVVVGLGGIFIEVFKDTAIRLAPVTKLEAWDMLKNLKAYPLLKGTRGKGGADMAALVEIICRVSSLLTACPEIAELDLNPVIVHSDGKGVSIVDARIFFDSRN